MRIDKSKIKFVIEFPIPVNEPDGNGIIYTEESIIKAYEGVNNVPLIQYDEQGQSVVIGIVEKAEYINRTGILKGGLFCGGSNESNVLLDEENGKPIGKVLEMEIESFGFSRWNTAFMQERN